MLGRSKSNGRRPKKARNSDYRTSRLRVTARGPEAPESDSAMHQLPAPAMQGQRWRRLLSTHAIHMVHAHRNDDVELYCPMHAHEYMEFVVADRVGGVTHFGSAGGLLEFHEGDVLFYPPRVQHDQRMSMRGGVNLVIGVEANLPLTPPLDRPQLLAVRIRSEIVARVERIVGAYGYAQDELTQVLMDSEARAILALLVREGLERDFAEAEHNAQRLARLARQHLGRQFAHIRSMRGIAEELGCSPDYLRHIFRAEYGQSMSEWLREVRIRHAQGLLAQTSLPIKKISRSSGFSRVQYFYRQFSRSTGVTPAHFRSQCGAAAPRPRAGRRRPGGP